MKIHLLGIGGTGMASLAGMLQASGHDVSGSDQGLYPPMSTLLEQWRIPVAIPYDAGNLTRFRPDFVVIGNVISRNNPEAQAVLSAGIPYFSMPEAIQRFFLGSKTSLVVAGTHGKTTTTSLIAWLLEHAGKEPSFFVGGKPQNFPQNFQLKQGPDFVLEGDEYDTAFFDKGPKFLHYQPEHVLLTSVEFDHADIYQDLEHVLRSFRKLLEKIPESGTLVANLDYPEVEKLLRDYPKKFSTYTLQASKRSSADFFAEILQFEGETRFRVHARSTNEPVDFHSQLFGAHNVGNALGALALLRSRGLDWSELREGLKSFRGVKRRQEFVAEIGGVQIFDDFAHHPTAVRETLAAFRRRFPRRRLWAVFEPRSNSSKRAVFQEEYARSFGDADQVLIADVFMPQKVTQGAVLDVPRIAREIPQHSPKTQARHISGTDAIVQVLQGEVRKDDVVLLMSNGNFDGLAGKIEKNLRQ